MASPNEIHKLMFDAWNRRDFAAMKAQLHAEYTYAGGDGKETTGGPDAGVAVAQGYAAAFPDGRVEIRNSYTSGNVAIAEYRARGTHGGELLGVAATGRPVDIVICNVIEMRDGKVYREREYVDLYAILQQIGAAGSAAGA
ncbi:MAG: ester cyclase [Bryobacteraceae bacterium]